MSFDVTLSGKEKTIQYILQWYEFQNKLSLRKKSEIKELQKENNFNEKHAELGHFYGMSDEELDEFFRELDYSAMLAILASAEAAINVDYRNRIFNTESQNELLKKYRVLHENKGNRVSLEKDLLGILKDTSDDLRVAISDFKGVFKLRHWLAHGRFEKPNLPRELNRYQVVDVYDIAYNLLSSIEVLGN